MEDPTLTYLSRKLSVGWRVVAVIFVLTTLTYCTPKPTPTPDPQAALIEKGRYLFFNETFNGNGRTCGTCHRAENNLTIDPAFIATLPDDDPLFVAEFIPALRENFENPRLMREFGLIVENLDGFGDLANRFTMRGVPHTLALPTSIASREGPRTGWSGDGSPGDGSLRSFAIGAVIQHFTKTLNRVPGVDFRLPTDESLMRSRPFSYPQAGKPIWYCPCRSKVRLQPEGRPSSMIARRVSVSRAT